MTPTYEIHAIRYAHHPRIALQQFTDVDPHETGDMPLDYFVWAIRGDGRTILVDTGFSQNTAAERGRQITNSVSDGLAMLGIRPSDVPDVVITHMHYDHAGNIGLFDNARFHLQDAEMEYVTGRAMCHHQIRCVFEADDVAGMVRRLFAGQVQFHDGVSEIAPGITVHRIGGHTKGLQVVRVPTARGWVVLASDASHLYAHMEQRRAFPILYNLQELLAGYDTLLKLASSPQHIIPGHDPQVIRRYPASSADTEGWIVRLDAEPEQ